MKRLPLLFLLLFLCLAAPGISSLKDSPLQTSPQHPPPPVGGGYLPLPPPRDSAFPC